MLFWAPRVGAGTAAQAASEKVGAWEAAGARAETPAASDQADASEAQRDGGLVCGLSRYMQRMGLCLKLPRAPAQLVADPCADMQWVLTHDTDEARQHAFATVPTSLAVRLAVTGLRKRLPALRVELRGSYELVAGSEFVPGEYVLTAPGAARANTSGPFVGLLSLELFDMSFMQYHCFWQAL